MVAGEVGVIVEAVGEVGAADDLKGVLGVRG